MASLKRLLDLLPESAGQTDVKYVCGYDPGQGAKVIEPFQVQGAGFFFAQAPRHEL
jgi:23S rRNA A1618 N6-methylase RlmF